MPTPTSELQASAAGSAGPPVLNCSFCGKDNASVGKLIAGPGAYICDGCIAICNRIVEREDGARSATTAPHDMADKSKPASSAAFGAWERLPNETLLRAASRTDRTLQDLKEVMKAQVSVLRTRGVTWSRIGDALGTSRQAVWERFR